MTLVDIHCHILPGLMMDQKIGKHQLSWQGML